MPKISAIVPVYNAEPYLSKCIDSILGQSFTDFELILIDDGSQDTSPTICDEFAQKDSRIKVIHKDNTGVSSSRNMGINMAVGEWICFIDSDDYIEPEYFNIDFNSTANLQVQNWKIFGGAKIKEEKLEKGFVASTGMAEFCELHLHMDMFRTVWCKFFRREIIEKNGIIFQIGCILGEDTLFMMEYMVHVHSVNIVASSNYMYWRTADWGKKYKLPIQDIIQYLSLFVSRYKKLPYKSHELLSFIFTWYAYLVPDFGYRKTKLQWYTAPPNLFIQKQLRFEKGEKFFIRYIYYKFISHFTKHILPV